MTPTLCQRTSAGSSRPSPTNAPGIVSRWKIASISAAVVGVAPLLSPTFRRIVRAIPPAWLIGVHAIRLAGFLFLALLDMRLVSAWLVAPLAVLALGSGLLLALLTPWGILRYWWVAIKLAITAILTGVVLSVLAPRLGALALAVSGPAPRELALAERIPLVVAPAVASTLLVVNVALAIFKPGWRTGLERRQHQ